MGEDDEGSLWDLEYATGGDTSGGEDWTDFASIAGEYLPVAAGAFGGNGGGNGGYVGGVTPAMAGVIPGAAAAGAALASLGARLAAMFGRGAGTAVINGVKFSMASLWPYIRKYGPASVAGALGISIAQLGALAMAAPQGKRRRRRGISARDISTSRRVIAFNKRLSRQLGTNRSYRSYRPRRGRHSHYVY